MFKHTNKSRSGSSLDAHNKQPVQNPGTSNQQRPLSHDIAALLVRIALMGSLFLVLFAFIFSAIRFADYSMEPSIQEGDMVIAYRLDKRFRIGDIALFSYEDKEMCSRVVAKAGDTVNITSSGLLINGSMQDEPKITVETTQFTDGVTFPLVVPEGQIFVLGDNRTKATDSRTLGCINESDTEGKVIAIFRRRGL